MPAPRTTWLTCGSTPVLRRSAIMRTNLQRICTAFGKRPWGHPVPAEFPTGKQSQYGLHYVDDVRVAADWAGVTPCCPWIRPSSLTTNYGQSAIFSVNAGGSPGYQWQRNSSAVSGATNSSLTLPSVSQTNEGSYTVVLTFGSGSITSTVATLTVNDPYVISGPTWLQLIRAAREHSGHSAPRPLAPRRSPTNGNRTAPAW